MATADVAPVQAQQYSGTRNSRQGTIGDLSSSKLISRVSRVHNLRFGTMGLFVDAGFDETFPSFGPPNPFIYALPDFSGAGNDFDGMSFEEYLTFVANSYSHDNSAEYLPFFQIQNAFTAETGYVPTSDEVFQVHRQDFLAGGGYFPIDKPTREESDFVPFPVPEPVETPDDTSAATLLKDAGILTDTELDDALDLIDQASASETASQAAPVVSNVPEPATLGLLAVGASALINRRRR